MRDFLNKNREAILPILSSVVLHLVLFLIIDDIVSLNIHLPEKKPQYVFIEPVSLQEAINESSIEKDLNNIKKQIPDIKKEKVEEEVKIKKKEVVKKEFTPKKVNIMEDNIKKIRLNSEKEKINIKENFIKKTVQTDIIDVKKDIALIDSEDVQLTKNITPPEFADIEKAVIKEEKDNLEIPIEEEEKESLDIKEPENINIEIENFNKDIKEIPKLISIVRPSYPKWAVDSGYQGFVKFKIDLNENGTVRGIVKYQANIPSDLIAHTADSVRKWVFKPLILNDKAVESTILVTIVYRLEILKD